MTDPFGDGFAKLRELEQNRPARGYPRRTAAEVRWFIEQTRLTLAERARNPEPDPDEWRWSRSEGKTETMHVEAPEPRSKWKLRRRMIRCGKAGCTTCPHGPYLYVRITAPGGAVSDVSLGRTPAASHVFAKLAGRLEGVQISAIVRDIREGGR